MLSPGSVASRDSITSALIASFLDQNKGPQFLSNAATILQTIYASDLRAYFITKPFYKAVGVMDFPQKVKDTYLKLEELANQSWSEKDGISALRIIEELAYKAEDCGKNIVIAKFIAQLLSLEEGAVFECISFGDVLFKNYLGAEINKKASYLVSIAHKSSNSTGGGSAATDTEEYDYHAPPSLSWM